MNTNIRLHGRAAIEYARAHNTQLYKYDDPVEHAGPVNFAYALEVAREDPSLIYLFVDVITDEQIEALRNEAAAACPDCKGSGVYVGLFSREVCKTCGGMA